MRGNPIGVSNAHLATKIGKQIDVFASAWTFEN